MSDKHKETMDRRPTGGAADRIDVTDLLRDGAATSQAAIEGALP